MGSLPEVDSGQPEKVGNYRLVASLGVGGMADVFLAVDGGLFNSAFTKLVVVKRVRPHLAEDAEYIQLLLDEARICARLSHPNVVQTIEVGLENDQPFLAMEYLEGQALARLFSRAEELDAPLPKSVSYAVVADVLRGLHHAHELKDFDGRPFDVVHRDVSPQNVFVTYDGHVKLLDFGIAKAAGRSVETRLGVARGKVRYMAPEQAAGISELDRRTDIFAVGVMLWQIAVEHRFWDNQLTSPQIMERLATGKYEPSPRAVRPDVPEAIDAICRRALAWVRDDRYETADEMLQELETYLGSDIVAARRNLIEAMRTMFQQDRTERRALIERIATSTSLAHSIGAVAMLAGKQQSSGRVPLVLDKDKNEKPRPSDPDVGTGVSLAHLLEPTRSAMTKAGRRRSQLRRVGLAFLAAVVSAVGIDVALRILGMGSETPASARPPSSTVEPRTGIAFSSDGVAHAPQPSAPPSVAPAKPPPRRPKR